MKKGTSDFIPIDAAIEDIHDELTHHQDFQMCIRREKLSIRNKKIQGFMSALDGRSHATHVVWAEATQAVEEYMVLDRDERSVGTWDFLNKMMCWRRQYLQDLDAVKLVTNISRPEKVTLSPPNISIQLQRLVSMSLDQETVPLGIQHIKDLVFTAASSLEAAPRTGHDSELRLFYIQRAINSAKQILDLQQNEALLDRLDQVI
jgi:hypothetical protein